MAFSRLFVFRQILFYCDFEWDKVTFLLSYFCVTKRRVQGGVATSERRRRDGVYQKSSKDFPSLENLPASSCFALCKQPSPSGANRASEPSRYSIVTATGSKRSSADSDSLLCHVRLWQTSRELTDSRSERGRRRRDRVLEFGCGTGCKHSEINVILIVSSAHGLQPRPRNPLSSGRADNACTNLLGSLV